MTTGWKLDEGARLAMIENFPPRYGNVIADHVTLLSNDNGGDGVAPPEPVGEAMIVGRADDGEGVEALVVAIDGSTDRPDGGTWHVTWSLGPGRTAKESNDIIRERGWEPLDARPLLIYPACW